MVNPADEQQDTRDQSPPWLDERRRCRRGPRACGPGGLCPGPTGGHCGDEPEVAGDQGEHAGGQEREQAGEHGDGDRGQEGSVVDDRAGIHQELSLITSRTMARSVDDPSSWPEIRAATRPSWSTTRVVGVARTAVTFANASLTWPFRASITLG